MNKSNPPPSSIPPINIDCKTIFLKMKFAIGLLLTAAMATTETLNPSTPTPSSLEPPGSYFIQRDVSTATNPTGIVCRRRQGVDSVSEAPSDEFDLVSNAGDEPIWRQRSDPAAFSEAMGPLEVEEMDRGFEAPRNGRMTRENAELVDSCSRLLNSCANLGNTLGECCCYAGAGAMVLNYWCC